MLPLRAIDQQGGVIMDQRASMPDSMNIAFQGVSGAFGEEAVCTYFEQGMNLSPTRHPYYSFADVFAAVAKGDVDYGVVPIENSQTGSIDDVYDLLNLHDLFVVGEVCLPVNQCLMCLPGQRLSDIRRVFSHPQALAQCKDFLLALDVEVITAYNTAGSAKMIREEHLNNTAAIAGPRAAELYQLEILARSIQTVKDNFTRFIILGRTMLPRSIPNEKTMLAITATRQSTALSRCLAVFAAHNLPILRVETRPSRQRAWEYIFFLEFEGHCKDLRVRSALTDLTSHTSFYKMLGSFARAI